MLLGGGLHTERWNELCTNKTAIKHSKPSCDVRYEALETGSDHSGDRRGFASVGTKLIIFCPRPYLPRQPTTCEDGARTHNRSAPAT